MSGLLLNDLDLPETIKQRINTTSDEKPNDNAPFVLYLPTVVLRKKHNPALALASRIANHLQIPLLILAVVLDDAHFPQANPKPVAFTARKVAFTLEAIQQAAQEWEAMGAGVAIRVHGPGCRTPHHLTLARTAAVAVLDEPFVHPYLKLTQSVEHCCRSAKVPAFRVDGSTLVPPISKLSRNQNGNYNGVPHKAWAWLKLTNDMRPIQVNSVVKNGHLDAPELLVKLEPSFFLTTTNTKITTCLPHDWSNSGACPGIRPWTVSELSSISNLKEWTMTCLPSIDTTVPPCQQTHGSARSGMQRWAKFRSHGLHSYDKTRNNVTTPHAVSRMSCYLNLGVVSIFTLVHDTWQSKSGGQQKYEDEIIKWREMAYAHAFAYPEYYNRDLAVPAWARKYLSQCTHVGQPISLDKLETGSTLDATWNAMQRYLVATGELHNNARMTWGKTMVHWQKAGLKLNELLEQLCYVNDRYALDGLAPPSYAGLLWCLGWCDKPDRSGRLSEKWASAYRTGPAGFVKAKDALLNSQQPSIATMFAVPMAKRQKKDPTIGEIN